MTQWVDMSVGVVRVHVLADEPLPSAAYQALGVLAESIEAAAACIQTAIDEEHEE